MTEFLLLLALQLTPAVWRLAQSWMVLEGPW